MKSSSIKILIVETERSLYAMLESALKHEGFELVLAYNGVEALRAMQIHKPDIVILDSTLAWLSGSRIRQKVWSSSSTVDSSIFIFNPNTEGSKRILPIYNQGHNSISNEFDTNEIISHIKTLHQNTLSQGKGILRAGIMEIDVGRCAVFIDKQPVALTTKEWGLLLLLLNAKGRVLTRDMLREIVWEQAGIHGLETRTVDVHIGRLRHKLGQAGQYILTVRGFGYRFGVATEFTNCSSSAKSCRGNKG